ncbi:acyl-CoA dehydrogenase family protein [Streptomyces phaeochromogenes]|uniref:acyl-CoA dehydrogenase family protein n=1 Tax=Streptomyces phaeochromogenes TaxID=1923 RepID=UPI00386E5BF1|nr:acyl-CoA dehydrogenase family protein [Streptomyces phaeochromogenes]WSW20066.1 acyl-CoA dehydrogenase family protein [Streptomyces phaeochromogenes]WTA01964.1 acyl-CoA dehydrogenase family protein [Streptomyces phaeochromogenes]
MRRTIFTAEHELFRDTARTFYLRECAPHAEQWERDGQVGRAAWAAAGKAGLIGWQFPEEYGGQGIWDFRYNAIMAEEMAATSSVGIGLGLQNDVIPPYLMHLTTPEQRARWLPGVIGGETICALALSEPSAGSDLKGIRTTARRDGDDWVIDGSKTFITNGILADLVIVACKTDPDAGHKGISLIVVERGTEGFERGRKLDKVGMKAQDTAELFFHEVRVPAENLIGQEGRGFYHMMGNLPTERLAIAVSSLAAAERAYALALEYAKTRTAFGQPIGQFQANRFALADIKAKLGVARVYVDGCIMALFQGELTPEEAAAAKYWTSETGWEVIDRCMQLFGGYGYVNEYEIARIWRDSRVQRVFGGTSEIMQEIIGRSLGL